MPQKKGLDSQTNRGHIPRMSDSLPPTAEPDSDAAITAMGSNALRSALGGKALEIAVRVKNNRVDYSFLNTPSLEPGRLLAALLHAGRHYPQQRIAMKEPTKRLIGLRGDSPVTMKHTIEIDFDSESIRSTQGKKVTLLVMSVIVENLAREAAASAPASYPEEPN